MSKHIKFEAVSTPGSNFQTVTVTILQQTNRGSAFGRNGSLGYESNGIVLKSAGCPEVGRSEIFMRGYNTSRDNQKLIMNIATFDKFKKAVEAYNAEFAPTIPAYVNIRAACPAEPCITTVG